MLFLLSLLALVIPVVVAAASTYRHMRFGNAQARHPFAFRYALGCALAETFTANPLSQHRARMAQMQAAEQRRDAAIARAMERHPAGTRPPLTEDPTTDEFVARVRATHNADQAVAAMAEALLRNPATLAAVARAKAVHPAIVQGVIRAVG